MHAAPIREDEQVSLGNERGRLVLNVRYAQREGQFLGSELQGQEALQERHSGENYSLVPNSNSWPLQSYALPETRSEFRDPFTPTQH